MDRRPRPVPHAQRGIGIDRAHWSQTGIIQTINKAQRDNVIASQKLWQKLRRDRQNWFGKKPEGEWADIADRYRPGVETHEGWWNFMDNMNNQLRCKVKAEYLTPVTTYPDEPLLAIVVEPLQDMPTTRPAHSETPYHISIGFYSTKYGPIKDGSAVNRANYKKALERIQRNYAEWQPVILTGHPQGGTWVLNDDSPVKNDPDIQFVHANSQYWDRGIHMTW